MLLRTVILIFMSAFANANHEPSLDFTRDIETLPKDLIEKSLNENFSIQENPNLVLRWTIDAPYMLVVPEIMLLSREETLLMVQKFASRLMEQPKRHTSIRFEDECRQNPRKDGRGYYVQHWIWELDLESKTMPSGPYQFILTAEQQDLQTCEQRLSGFWLEQSQIDSIPAKLEGLGECGFLIARTFSSHTHASRYFTRESYQQHAERIMSLSKENAPRFAQEKCGDYDILPCIIPLESCLDLKAKEAKEIILSLLGIGR